MTAKKTSSKIKTLHIAFASHLDIGYTGSTTRTELDHKENLDTVLRLMRKHPDYCYMVETAWILRQWLDRTDDPALIDEMRQRLREGRIEIGGFFTTPHSAVCGPEDLNQYAYEARRLRDELGVDIVSAIQCDVPGYSWAYPQILTKSGIKYMFAGLNIWLGGGIENMHSRYPFYWEGVDGSRVLTFAQVGYGAAHAWKIPWLFSRSATPDETIEDARKAMDAHIADLEQKGFPFDTAFVFCSEGDNQGPVSSSYNAFKRIQEWNAAGNTPRIEVSTLKRYFSYMEKKYADQIPVVRGDWPAAYEWDLVKVRGPQGTTGYREAQALLPTAEKLLALDQALQGATFPRADVEAAWNYIRLYDEHSAPEAEAVWLFLSKRHLQWLHQEHHHYAKEAWHRSRMLLHQGLIQFNQWAPEDQTVVVFNPLWFERTDTVRVPLVKRETKDEKYLEAEAVIDLETGERIACDNGATGSLGGDATHEYHQPCLVFTATKVPAMGYKFFKVVPRAKPAKAAKPAAATQIENARYRVKADPKGAGILSIYDKQLKRELVTDLTVKPEKGKKGKVKQVLFNGFLSDSELSAHKATVKRIDGATFQKLEIRRPGTWLPETDIRLTVGSDRVEVRNTFDRAAWKKQYPEEGRCDIRLQFPFKLKAKDAGTVVSGPTGFRRTPQDVVPGAPQDTWSSSAFLALSDKDVTVLMSSPVDYLFMPGERKGNTVTAQTQTFFQRYDLHTLSDGAEIFEYTEPQEDDRIVRSYALSSHAGAFDATRAQRFGWGYRSDMAAAYIPNLEATPRDGKDLLRFRNLRRRVLDGFVKNEKVFAKPAASLLSTSDADVAIQAFRRSLFAGQNFYILRLQEMAGKKARKVCVKFHDALPLKWAAEASMTENKGKAIALKDNTFELTVSPFETVTIALDLKR